MIPWRDICYDLSALSKLPNGSGAEIEFDLHGKSYAIVHDRDHVTLAYFPNGFEIGGKYIERSYLSMEELGAATDFGFRLKDEWKHITNFTCRPDFEEFTLDEVLKAY